MSSVRHDLVGRLFSEGLEVPLDERDTWLGALDAPADVVDEVRGLLEVDSGDVPFLDTLPAAIEPPSLPGFEFEELIGRGGMGVVWKARQAQPDRHVAVKVLASNVMDGALSRFRREIDALGRLEHDSIARVYEAGVSGRDPFIVMEFVDGRPLGEFARSVPENGDDADAGLETILELFVQVCDGVAHAHGRGIIHRDLKPANVIVTAAGVPKILDFGIARMSDEAGDDATLQTRTGMVLGTLPYMSPEQARGDAGAVDVRTDVYSLGVLLFELLEGKRPIELDGLTLTRAVERICEEGPPRLTSRGHRFDRDLETIVSHAMAKEPERRYRTAAALADDIRRLLRDEPVAARPPSAAYLASRFARRHRTAVIAAAVIGVVLIVASVVSVSFALRERSANSSLREANRELREQRARAVEETERADKEARTANAFVMFVFDTLLQEDPTRGGEPTLREAIERVAGNIDDKFADFPVIRARLHRFVGRMFEALGRPREGVLHLRQAFELYQRHAPSHEDASPLFTELAQQELRTGRTAEADRLLSDRIARLADAGEEDAPEYRRALDLRTEILLQLGRFEEARSVAQRALALCESAGDVEGRESSLYSLAGALLRLNQLDQAEAHLEELAESRRERLRSDHPYLAEAVSAQGALMLQRDEPARAIPFIEEALSIQEATLGATHTATVESRRLLALAFELSGDLEGALTGYRRVLEVSVETQGAESFAHGMALTDTGRLHMTRGNLESARADLDGAIRIFEALGPTVYGLDAWFLRATLEKQSGRLDEAARWALAGIEIARRSLPRGHALVEYLGAAVRTCYDAEKWEACVSLLADLAALEREGLTFVDPVVAARFAVMRGEALLRHRGAEAAEEIIEDARDRVEEMPERPVDLLRMAVEVELKLRRLQDDAEAVRELEGELVRLQEREG